MLRVLKVILLLLVILNIVFMFLFINTNDDSEEFDVAQIEVTADLKHVFSNSKVEKGLLAIKKESESNKHSNELQKQIDFATQQSQMNQLQSEIESSSIDESISPSEVNTASFLATPTSLEIDSIKTPDEAVKEKAKLLREANDVASLRKKELFSKIDKNQLKLDLAEKNQNLSKQEVAKKLKLAQDLPKKKEAEKLKQMKLLAKQEVAKKLKLAQDLAKKKEVERPKQMKLIAKQEVAKKLKLAQDLAKKKEAERLKQAKLLAKQNAAKKLKLAQDLAKKKEAERLKRSKLLAKQNAAEVLLEQVNLARKKALEDLRLINEAKRKVAEEKEKLSRGVTLKEKSNIKSLQRAFKTRALSKPILVNHVIYNPKNLSLLGNVSMQWINRSVLKIKYPKSWATQLTGDKLTQDHLEFWMDIDGIEPKSSYGNISYQIGIGLSKKPWIKNFLKTDQNLGLKVTTLSYGDTNELLISNIPRDLKSYNLVFSKSSDTDEKSQALLLSASKSFKWGDEKTLLLKH